MIAIGKSATRFFATRAPLLRLAALGIVFLFAAPVAAVVAGAFDAATSDALSSAALADYVLQTALYACLTLILALMFALPAAWMTVTRRFPGDRFVAWALCMPLALPPYITAHGWEHFLQTQFKIYADGIIPAAAATALAVYPYIYIFARAALRQQSRHLQSAARLMGCSRLSACRLISWPMARPAIVVGAALALMETLNDIAVAELFGVRTLGLGVYDLWLNRGDLTSACRLSAMLMLLVVGILLAEERGRRRQKLYAAQCDRRFASDRAAAADGGGYWCAPLLLLPALGGFFLPAGWYAYLFARTNPELWRAPFLEGLGGTLILSFSLMAALFVFAMIAAADKRKNGRGALMTPAAKLSQAGYALPGAVLAQGFFLLAAATGGGVAVAIGRAGASRFGVFGALFYSRRECGGNRNGKNFAAAGRGGATGEKIGGGNFVSRASAADASGSRGGRASRIFGGN